MSLNSEVHMSIEACTTIKVTGELKALHWKKLCDRIIWKEFFPHNWAAEKKVTRHALKNCGRKLNMLSELSELQVHSLAVQTVSWVRLTKILEKFGKQKMFQTWWEESEKNMKKNMY